MDQNVFGIRLRLARKMAGKSLQDLSNDLGNKVTKQALSKYELGDMKPTTDVLLMIASALKIAPDYLLRKQQVELGQVLFRKKVSLTKKDEEAVIEKARDYIERYSEIENILGIQNIYSNPLANDIIRKKADVEDAAKKLRLAWHLGDGPIPNLSEMLELKGIKVLLLYEVDGVDGLSVITSSGIPVVVVNVKDKSVERIRFTIIHELAHLLLRFEEELEKDMSMIEKLCHYFASCFLIPSERLLKMVGSAKRSYIAIKELISIKEYFGISIRAILHRLSELEVIIPVYYQKWCVYLSKTFGGKLEPGKYVTEEKSNVFDQLINRALAEGVISISKAASLSNQSINEIRKGWVDVN